MSTLSAVAKHEYYVELGNALPRRSSTSPNTANAACKPRSRRSKPWAPATPTKRVWRCGSCSAARMPWTACARPAFTGRISGK